jgi:hypothetical protein
MAGGREGAKTKRPNYCRFIGGKLHENENTEDFYQMARKNGGAGY